MAPVRALEDQARRAMLLGSGIHRMRSPHTSAPAPREAGFDVVVASPAAVSALRQTLDRPPMGVDGANVVLAMECNDAADDERLAGAIREAGPIRSWRCSGASALGPASLHALLDRAADSTSMQSLEIAGDAVGADSMDHLVDAVTRCTSLTALAIRRATWKLRSPPVPLFVALRDHPHMASLTIEASRL